MLSIIPSDLSSNCSHLYIQIYVNTVNRSSIYHSAAAAVPIRPTCECGTGNHLLLRTTMKTPLALISKRRRPFYNVNFIFVIFSNLLLGNYKKFISENVFSKVCFIFERLLLSKWMESGKLSICQYISYMF